MQALTLYGELGASAVVLNKIEAVTGIKKSAFFRLLERAKKRGYVKGGKIEPSFVKNKPKGGRPIILVPKTTEIIEKVVTKNSTTRSYNSEQIAKAVAKQVENFPALRAPSRRTILRYLKKAGFKCVKRSTKPGLNKLQKLRRLI